MPINRASLSFWNILGISLFVWLTTCAVYWIWAMQNAPSENQPLERLLVIGRYSQQDASYSRTPFRSFVAGTPIYCDRVDFFSTNRYGCNLKQVELQEVAVERVAIPTYQGHIRVVAKVSAGTYDYMLIDDATIRAEWLSGTRFFCLVYSFLLGFICTFFLLLQYKYRSPSKVN